MSSVAMEPPARDSGGGNEARGTGWLTTSRTFLSEVRNEMRRVTWPTRREVQATTLVVILTSAFFGLYLWGIDLALSAAVAALYRMFV
jgi:preprotein translocase subunit SecE